MYCFAKSGVTDVIIPASVKRIDERAFYHSALMSADIASGSQLE